MSDRHRVIVVGAGLSGLTLVLALRRRGIDASVLERAAHLRESGAAVALSANSVRLLERVGLGPQLAASSIEPSELVLRHWRTGRRLGAHPIGLRDTYRRRFGAPYYGIPRADLLAYLATACTDGPITTGWPVCGMDQDEQGVTLRSADGKERAGDIVVGADGAHSVVRRAVTAREGPIYSGTTGFRGLVPRSAVDGLPSANALQFWAGPGAHVLHYGVAPDLVNVLAVIDGPPTWPEAGSNRPVVPAEANGVFAHWHPAVRQLIRVAAPSQQWALLSQRPLRRWSRGRVVLVGDAAHTMLPHHGQGANQAIEDAFVLAGCIAEAGIDDYAGAFDRYTRLRRTRTRAIQRSSWIASARLHLPDGADAATRDHEFADFPERFGWIHEYDAERHVETGTTPIMRS